MTNNLPRAGRSARALAQDNSGLISTQDMSEQLVRVLGKQLLSVIFNERGEGPQNWVDSDAAPSTENEKRLRDTYKVYELLRTEDHDRTVRAWFMGMNSQLEDISPAEALALGRARDVMIAARSFVNGA